MKVAEKTIERQGDVAKKGANKSSLELRFVYMSLFVCVIIPLVLALVVGHVSGYYTGFEHLGLNGFNSGVLFSVLTPIMFGVFGLGLHFTIISTRSTELNFKLSLYLWATIFLFSLAWIVVFYSSSILVMAFVWMAIVLALSVMLTILSFKMNIISAICSLLYTSWLAIITYILMMALVGGI